MSHREKLIATAERYQAQEKDLPVGLYAALMELGIDASQYQTSPTNLEKEESND